MWSTPSSHNEAGVSLLVSVAKLGRSEAGLCTKDIRSRYYYAKQDVSVIALLLVFT